jgi:hypothetical protein
MATQMQTLSARVPSEDVEWLATLPMQGASSPSDKLRALIAQMRRQHEGSVDYAAGIAWLRDMLAPCITAIRAFEHHEKEHSELLTTVAEAVPQIMATLISANGLKCDDRARAIELENMVAQRVLQLSASVLRLAVTKEAACYNPAVIDANVSPVIEIAEIVAQTRRARKG